jgi:hypothetical protein
VYKYLLLRFLKHLLLFLSVVAMEPLVLDVTKKVDVVANDSTKKLENAKSNCPHLPLEIWANILQHVDDTTLWMDCRRVSHMLRAEVEQEFARCGVPKIVLKRVLPRGSWTKYPWMNYPRIMDLCVQNYMGLSRDTLRACFSTGELRQDCARRFHSSKRSQGHDERYPPALKHSDLIYGSFDEIKEEYYAVAKLGRGTVPISDIEMNMDTTVISFNWRDFLNRFYANKIIIRQFQDYCEQPSAATIQKAKDWIASKTVAYPIISRQEWEGFRDNFCDANKEWHCSVYIEGQKRTHRLADLPLVRKEMEEEVRHNVDVALMVRNRRLWKSLM